MDESHTPNFQRLDNEDNISKPGSGYCGDSSSDHDTTESEYSFSDADDFLDCASSQPGSVTPDDVVSGQVETLAEIGLKAFLWRTWPRKYTNKRCRSWSSSPESRKRLELEFPQASMASERNVTIDDEISIPGENDMAVRKVFTCPFYVRHPVYYSRCLTRANIRGIPSLLRHLFTYHRQPIYCPTCRNVFTKTKECDDHIRSRQCRLCDATHSLGMTPEQMLQLSRQARNWRVADLEPTYVMEALQWFAIWTLIFPEDKLPSRPYITGKLESTICAVRDFWSIDGLPILTKFFHSRSSQCSSSSLEEGSGLELLQRTVLNRMIDILADSSNQGCGGKLPQSGNTGKILTSLGYHFSRDFWGLNITFF